MGVTDSVSGKEEKSGVEEIREKARLGRAYALMAIGFAKSGHPGGALSVMDVMATLYFNELKHDPKKPFWSERDRFFLSGQHKCPAQYALMGLAGYFPVKDFVVGLRLLGSPFQGHPDWLKLKGVEMSGGSLGQGLSIAVGDALAAKLDEKDYRVYCVMGDGEQQEGSVWEAAMSAAHYKLDNLCGVVDVNGLQIDGRTCDVMSIEPLAEKYRGFGWNVLEVDGHDVAQLLDAFKKARETKGVPTAIIARTVKGKGISFMENKAEWHGKAPSMDLVKKGLKDLGCEELLTRELIDEARKAREKVSKEYGALMPLNERLYWWNVQGKMKAVMKPTRFGFGEALDKCGGDERIVCLGADISDSIKILDFCKNHPERKKRFLNFGIAEQNMTTAAAGLAKEGKIPVIGSYGIFVTGRNWDQLRTTICYGNLNVKIAVGHGGVSVGPDGATHQSLEDVSLLAVLPNMRVIVPCDAIEARKATEHLLLKEKGPCAVRLAREATPVVTKEETPFVFGEANVIRFRKEVPEFVEAFEVSLARKYSDEGEKITLVACGPEVPEAMRAAWMLKKAHGIEARVLNLHSIKPLDRKALVEAARETKAVVVAEEHQKGGIGNLVAGALAEEGVCPPMRFVGVNDCFGESGESWELVWKYELAGEHIVREALKLLSGKTRK